TAVSRPGASRNALSDPTADRPTIVPDEVGTYQFSVVATDSTGLQSEPRFVSFTTTNCGFATPTVVSAAASATAPNPGDVVTLSAVVQDADNVGTCNKGQTLTLHWAFVTRPASSSAFLNNPAAQSPSFTPDVVGTYQFSVTARDGTGNTSPSTFVGVTTTNCGTHAPSVTILSGPPSPVPGTAILVAAVVTDDDNFGTCNHGETFTFAWSLARPPASVTAF